MPSNPPIIIATRGSALALAQANAVLGQCRRAFPQFVFEIKIIKTTGDKLQTVALSGEGASLPKGLFTKELEIALLERHADLAVHSLKDLPTELPAGLQLGAIGKRADVRDVLIHRAAGFSGQSGKRGYKQKMAIADFPSGAVIGTSSPRRKCQLLALRPDFQIVEHRGNVPTRIEKLAGLDGLDAIVLAAAGLERLNFQIAPDGKLAGAGIPDGLLAVALEPEIMLPCVGQGAIGIETREKDEFTASLCEKLNHDPTRHCVTAERAFLAAMGGGCQSPVAAYAQIIDGQIRLRAMSFRDGPVRRGEITGAIKEAAELGRRLAGELK